MHSLGDSRIKYFRTESFVPVTDNWNNAIKQSTGDYVVMLGDDDGLLPGYFSTMLKAFAQFPDPDFVYVSAFFYAYPGVMPDAPAGFLRRDRNGVFKERQPFWLDDTRAKGVVQGYLNFKMPVASNMQFSLISRRKLFELSRTGPFFQSPYPDFYATPMLFLTSARILIYPEPLVVIGITPKSYGFFHFNNRAADGVKFLKNDERLVGGSSVEFVMLPGTSYNDSWLLAMEALYKNHAGLRGMRPNYRRYRFLQIVHVYKKCYFDGLMRGTDLTTMRSRMYLFEKLIYGLGLPVGFRILRIVPNGFRARAVAALRRMIGQHPISEKSAGGPFNNLLEVFESMNSTQAAVR